LVNNKDEPGIQFFSPGSFSQQVAYMKHPQEHKISAHDHNMMTRQVLVPLPVDMALGVSRATCGTAGA